MQSARDSTPADHRYFYVVWPEEKSELPISPQASDQASPARDPATSTSGGSSTHESTTATVNNTTKESQGISSASRRYTESPVQSPEVEYLTSKQQQVCSPLTMDIVQTKSTSVTSNYSPIMTAHSQRSRGSSSGHQMITFPASAPTVVPNSQPQILFSAGVTTFMGNNNEMQKELGGNHIGESPGQTVDLSHSLLLPQNQKQVLHLGNPMSVTRNQDISGGFRRIGALAEQAVINLQKILQTASRFQSSTPKLQTTPPITVAGGEHDKRLNTQDSGYLGTPPQKRFCAWDSVVSPGTSTACMECEVKVAEIQVLRKRIQFLQEQQASLNDRNERLFSAPLLSTPTIESPRIQQSGIKTERVRVPVTLPSIHSEQPFSVEQLATTSVRGRKSIDTKHSQAPGHTDTQLSTAMPSPQANEVTELMAGSGVYILTHTLLDARKDAKSGTQLARKLMDAFWDKDTLAKSTLTPRSKFQYQQLDPKIIKAIEAYCLMYDDTVHSKDIHATMTDKCCQARSRIRTLQPDIQSEPHKSS